MSDNVVELSPHEKIAAAHRLLVGIYPNFGIFFGLIQFNEMKDITLRLSTKIGSCAYIEYNPAFINAISDRTLAALLQIELLRLILHHPTTRLMAPYQTCYLASNIICTDTAILNLNYANINEYFPKIDIISQIDPEFNPKTDLYMERVFDILEHARESEQKSEDSDETDIMKIIARLKDHKVNNDFNTFEDQDDALKKHFSTEMMIKSTEKWGANDILDGRVQKDTWLVKDNPKGWGLNSGDIIEMISIANENKHDVSGIISQFKRSCFSNNFNYSKMMMPKHYGELAEQFLGIIPGHRITYQARILFACDSSGSMNMDDIQEGFSFLKTCMFNAECYYCTWDCTCTVPQICTNVPEFKITGGGGTDPQCIITMLQENGLSQFFDGIIVFTDCGFEWHEPEINTNIMIVQSRYHATPPDWCKWCVNIVELRNQ